MYPLTRRDLEEESPPSRYERESSGVTVMVSYFCDFPQDLVTILLKGSNIQNGYGIISSWHFVMVVVGLIVTMILQTTPLPCG